MEHVVRAQNSRPTFTHICLQHQHQRAKLSCLIRILLMVIEGTKEF
ncbi:hypothetical protein AAZX31_12G135400 [Glycine max]